MLLLTTAAQEVESGSCAWTMLSFLMVSIALRHADSLFNLFKYGGLGFF